MAKKIMFQGTGSSVGKSLMVAAVCRILNNQGLSVAPFKSQNMALNSFITSEGKEMGRAQVVQAEAARIEPAIAMNPILLKPTSHVGCQVILNGEVYSNMSADKYFTSKEMLIPHILKAFDILDKKYEVIVIEGAGSPAEINLRSKDVVNMGLAELVDTDVILIGDVDKGGVFASLYGTYMLLAPNEQARIKGFVINKFRGDVNLLLPGVKMLEDLIPVPCIGIIPHIEDLKIDDEDSVTDRFMTKSNHPIKVGVLKLPYMSNFTDFTVFDMEPDVSLEYVLKESDLTTCDLIIIPGSKNTISDMISIGEAGLQKAIYKAHRIGIPIIGICGGYQILGQTIEDPYHVESKDIKVNGMGLLNIKTVMSEEKVTQQNTGEILENLKGIECTNQSITGYEIHMGISTRLDEETKPFIQTKEGVFDGAINNERNIMGTYFHGIFDNDGFRKSILDAIRTMKGLTCTNEALTFEELKDQEYDRLATHVKENLNMDKLMQIISESR